MNAEDIISVPGTRFLLISGYNADNSGGHIYLMDKNTEFFINLTDPEFYLAGSPSSLFSKCPSPVDISNFSPHGLALKEIDENLFDIYMTSHGAREAIEIFELNTRNISPKLSWKGCVELDSSFMHNSVSILSDGGFVTTQFMNWQDGIDKVFAMEKTGSLVEWHPEQGYSLIPSTEMAGANGISISDDESTIYVGESGTGQLVKYQKEDHGFSYETFQLPILPDNVRWTPTDNLILAGSSPDAENWHILEFNTTSDEVKILKSYPSSTVIKGVSSALKDGEKIYVGTYGGDRIAVVQE